MRKKLIVLIVGSLLATPSFAAPKNRAPKEESIGVGSGAAIGALAGGPIGFVVGAAFGGWLGDRFHHERTARREADEHAAQATAHAASLEQMLAVKRAFDPKGTLNPGKVIPTLNRCAEYGKMLVRGGRLAHPELPRF